ncbi:MAG TPA: hypothetical protein VEN78_02250 [Bradyrhizobium sp.]|nr:hypothetical protein [Bradyrhizobium sp.]
MAFFIVALLKSREPMRVARPLLVVELWPNSLTEYLGLQIWRAAGEDAARCQRAVALPTTIHHQPEAGLLIPVNQLYGFRLIDSGEIPLGERSS